jgi:hypothetical protein
MPDLHPTEGNISTLPTSPPVATTAVYRKRPLIGSQLGMATSYSPSGEGFVLTRKPSYYQLSVWDEARRKEPVIKQGIEYIVQSLLAKIGSYSHPDKKIDAFVQANIVTSLPLWVKDIAESMLWSGFGVSEINWVQKKGPGLIPQIWVDSLINYHPLQIYLEPNDYGLIKDGEKITNCAYKSGIWVPAPPAHINVKSRRSKKREYNGNLVRLPLSKRIYMTLGGEGNNIYGRSILESIISYHFFKEAFRDMLTTALDRYGTPLIYAIVPPMNTDKEVINPDGSSREMTLHELTAEELKNLSSESALVFTQISKDQPIKLEALTTGNNFSTAFTDAMEMCDYNMQMGIGIPNLLMKDNSSKLGSGGASEKQLELYDTFISSLFDLIVAPFIKQLCSQLIQYNFDARTNPLAYDCGIVQKKPTKTTELKVVVGAVESLTRMGYINPFNSLDFHYVRDLIGLPARDPDKFNVLPDNKQERTNINKEDINTDAPTEEEKRLIEVAAYQRYVNQNNS